MSHRTPLVAGNWKMHGTKASVEELLSAIRMHDLPSLVEFAVFPPFVFLEQTQKILANTAITWGAQNISEYQQPGAYTGEISGAMLYEFGCRYVLIGHSERRTLCRENDQQLTAKFLAAQAANLTPVLCVGETLAQREAGAAETVIKSQLDSVITGLESPAQLANAVIAYEPVWAIGTGLSASSEQAQAMHAFIRQCIANYAEIVAQKIRILYGGSVKPDNAATLFAMPDIDGGLIGGASLNAKDFLEIGKLCNSCY